MRQTNVVRARGEDRASSPWGLYVHVPFCSTICPYCDFAVARDDPAAHGRYLDALAAEGRRWTGQLAAVEFDSVYVGGGTPSALGPEELARLFAELRESFRFSPDVVFSLEANPEDVNERSVAAWRRLGVDRVSLGVQALDDEVLRRLGRRHRRRDALRAVEHCLAADFLSVSVDLIYRSPGMMLESWRRDLREVASLGVDHLSCYELTVHEGTPFARWRDQGRLPTATEDEQACWFEITHRMLDDAGFEGYEVSNFARHQAAQSRHNWKYWRHEPYLGIGPSAHSFFAERRFWNAPSWGEWSARVHAGVSPESGGEDLAPPQLVLEKILLGLRTREGIDLVRLAGLAGDPAAVAPWAEACAARYARYLTLVAGSLVPSLAGMAVADRLAVELSALLEGG